MRETIRYPLTGSDICDRGGRARNAGALCSAAFFLIGSVILGLPHKEFHYFGYSLWFFSAIVAGMTVKDNLSRIWIRDQELDERVREDAD